MSANSANSANSYKIDHKLYPNINELLKSYYKDKDIKNKDVTYKTEIRDTFIDNYDEVLKLREWYSEMCGLPDTTVESWSTVNIENKKTMQMPNFRFCLIYMIKDLKILLEGNRDPGYENYLFPKGDFKADNNKVNVNTFEKVVLTNLKRKPRSSTSIARYPSTLKRNNNTVKKDNITDFAKKILEDIDEVIKNGIYYIPFMEVLMKFLFLFTYGDKIPLSKYDEYRQLNFNTDKLTECVGLSIIIKSFDTPYIIYPISYFVSYRIMNCFMLAPVLPMILSNAVRKTDNIFLSACGQINHDIVDHSEFTHGFHSFVDYKNLNLNETGLEFFKKLFNNLNKYCNPDTLRSFNYNIENIPKFEIPYPANSKIEFSSLNKDQKNYLYTYIFHLIFHEIFSFGSCAYDDKIIRLRLHSLLSDNKDLKFKNIYEVIGNNPVDLINYLRVIQRNIIFDIKYLLQLNMLNKKGISNHENFLLSQNALRKAVNKMVYHTIPKLSNKSKNNNAAANNASANNASANDKLIKKILDLLIYSLIYDYRNYDEKLNNTYIENGLKNFITTIPKIKYIHYLDPISTKTNILLFFTELLGINIAEINIDKYNKNNYINSKPNNNEPCTLEFSILIQWKLIQSVLYPYNSPQENSRYSIQYGPIKRESLLQTGIKVEIADISNLFEIWEPNANPTEAELRTQQENKEDITKIIFPSLTSLTKDVPNYGIPDYTIIEKTGDKPNFYIESKQRQNASRKASRVRVSRANASKNWRIK
jgi:hypothetical protein